MYTSFYKLTVKPFQISSDPAFMWMGEKHKEALATLRYGILDNKGFLLLTGDVGTGKTTLINSLVQNLADDVICTSVPDPSLSKLDFFNFIASSFGIEQEFSSKGAFLARFREFLLAAHENNKKVLLIIDEAQLLNQELLEEIRLLSNIEKADTKLINIFFVGQNEFNEILNQPQNRAVRQRLTLNYNIDPLTPEETAEYVHHRLEVAGAKKPIFESSALQEVFLFSGGFPRRINVICDHALLSGYVKDQTTIDARIVQECAKDLKIPAFVRNREIDGFSVSTNPMHKVQSRQVLLKPRPPEKESRLGSVVIGIAGFLLFLVLCWWFLFPVSFHAAVTRGGENFSQIASRIGGLFDSSEKGSVGPNTQMNPAVNKTENTSNSAKQPSKILTSNETTGTDEPARDIKKTVQPAPRAVVKKKSPQPLVQDELDSGAKAPELASESASVIKPPVPKAMPESETTARIETPAPEAKTKPVSQVEIEKEILSIPKGVTLIRFRYNTNNFTEEGFKKLKNFADVLIMHPDTRIRISGYTDSDGSQSYNTKLSEFRANIVKSFLLGKGVRPEQIETRGMGRSNPIESNDTAWGKMMNRRVEIEVIQ